jgi:hypothetical protein
MEKRIFIPKSEHEDDKIIYQRLKKHLSGPSKIIKLHVMEEESDINIPGSTEDEQIKNLLSADFIIPIISIDLLTNDQIIKRLEMARNANRKLIFVLGRPCNYDDTHLLDENTPILPDKKTFLLEDKTLGIQENQLKMISGIMKNIFTGFNGMTVPKNSKFLWMAVFCLISGFLLSAYIYIDSNNAFLSLLTFCMFLVIGFTSFLMYKNFSFTINLSFGK